MKPDKLETLINVTFVFLVVCFILSVGSCTIKDVLEVIK